MERRPALSKYELREEIGHGGMATVYRAEDPRLGRDVAVKVLHPHLRESAEVAHRFAAEARAVAKLRHPSIVEVYDVSSSDDDEQYLVVELIRGPTLRRVLQTHHSLPPEVAAALALHLLDALAHAHGLGVIHRDVKPENVLLECRPVASSADGPVAKVAVKLTDFGIAKMLDAQGVTSTGQVLGSPAHMAPEQIEGADVDARADLFGLGVLLYECMVGHLPFEGNNPAQVLRRVLDGLYTPADRDAPTVGKVWSEILGRALAREPDMRFAEAGEMRDAMRAELARLGFASPDDLLAAWMTDPKGFSATHAETLKERLCALGAEERRRGAIHRAAADYNRALAYAPHDPALLKLVMQVQRAARHRHFGRRVVPLVLSAVIVAGVAFYVTRAVRTRVALDTKLSPRVGEMLPAGQVSAVSSVIAVDADAPTPVVKPPPVVSSKPAIAQPDNARRTIRLHVNLPAGVLVSVDGQPAGNAPGAAIVVDRRQHVLEFRCVRDLCEPVSRTLSPGDRDETLEIALKIRPARLRIEGDPTGRYLLEERSIEFRTGDVISVPMSESEQRFTVRDLRSGSTKKVTLLAGNLVEQTFAP